MIDYSIIADAIKYYDLLGYENLDVPWLVKEKSVTITMPSGSEPMKIGAVSVLGDYRCLVASGEQSFMQMMEDGTLQPNRKYVCCTPCFRDEKNLSYTVRHYFLKVELIRYFSLIPDINREVQEVCDEAYSFFRRYTRPVMKFLGDATIDIEDIQGLELGSYGFRCFGKHYWIYGTGVAEPRCSISRQRMAYLDSE